MWESRSESAVLVSAIVICIIIVWNVVTKLGKVLPFRVNCWFCNGNTWVRLPESNSWTCPSCEQYNGFTKDGDYNRPLPSTPELMLKTPHATRHLLSVDNGLCRMCNVNQQLKVAQLANFVPISEATFDKEIISYKLQLEKAYKLCSSCRKVLKAKLHKEKESLLGSKQLENRTPKKYNTNENQNKSLKKIIKYFSMTITLTLIILITADCYNYITKYKEIRTTIMHCKQLVYMLINRTMTVLKIKMFHAFPFLHDYEDISYPEYVNYYYNETLQWMPKINLDYTGNSSHQQQTLAGVGCITQIMCHFLKKNIVKHETVTETLWAVLLLSFITRSFSTPILLSVKLLSASALFLVYKNADLKSKRSIFASPVVSAKKIKSLVRGHSESWTKSHSDSEVETDDDVSLSQYGIDNSTSSNDTKSLANNSFLSGKFNSSFSKKAPSLWSVPTANSSFNCSSPFMNSSISHTAQQIHIKKPDFNNYQKMETNESDSDLDEGINGLRIGTSPKKFRPSSSIFSIKKFDTLSPRFAVPLLLQQRPLISPSKLGQGTSWVAGGYWGEEGSRGLFDAAASRSSSQSSGFESHASSLQRNVFSQPPSREESVCSELDRTSIFSDPPPQQFSAAVPNSFSNAQMRSPVHPQLRYDGHIHIPVPLVPSRKSHNLFSNYRPNSSLVFPSANRVSGLIKLPQVN